MQMQERKYLYTYEQASMHPCVYTHKPHILKRDAELLASGYLRCTKIDRGNQLQRRFVYTKM